MKADPVTSVQDAEDLHWLAGIGECRALDAKQRLPDLYAELVGLA
jgi:hypothetical protein